MVRCEQLPKWQRNRPPQLLSPYTADSVPNSKKLTEKATPRGSRTCELSPRRERLPTSSRCGTCCLKLVPFALRTDAPNAHRLPCARRFRPPCATSWPLGTPGTFGRRRSEVLALADQLGDQRPANCAGRPGDEDFLGCPPFSPSTFPPVCPSSLADQLSKNAAIFSMGSRLTCRRLAGKSGSA